MVKLSYNITYISGERKGINAVLSINIPLDELKEHVYFINEDIKSGKVLKNSGNHYIIKGIVND